MMSRLSKHCICVSGESTCVRGTSAKLVTQPATCLIRWQFDKCSIHERETFFPRTGCDDSASQIVYLLNYLMTL
jgi:hypothetical protein